MPSEPEIAWAAGFFEGEGYISAVQRQLLDGPRLYPNIGIKNTDLEMLRRFQTIVGVGVIKKTYFGALKAKPHHKDSYRWLVTHREGSEHVISLLSPWLSDRRLQRISEVFDNRGNLKQNNRKL